MPRYALSLKAVYKHHPPTVLPRPPPPGRCADPVSPAVTEIVAIVRTLARFLTHGPNRVDSPVNMLPDLETVEKDPLPIQLGRILSVVAINYARSCRDT